MCCVTPRAPSPPRKGRLALASSAGRSRGFVWSWADDRSFQANHPGSAVSGRDGAGTEAAGNLRRIRLRAPLHRETHPGGPRAGIAPHGLVVPTSIPCLKASSEYLGACASGLSCQSPRHGPTHTHGGQLQSGRSPRPQPWLIHPGPSACSFTSCQTHPNSTSPCPRGNFMDKPLEPHGEGESQQPSLEGAREHPHQFAELWHLPRSHRHVVMLVTALGLTHRLTQLLSTD